MLPSLHSRLRILIANHTLYASYRSAGLQPQITAYQVPISAGLYEANMGDAFKTLFMQIKPQINCRCDIYLADHHVRFMSLPSIEVAMSTAEKEKYAQVAMSHIWGDQVQACALVIQDQPPQRKRLVAAMTTTMQQSLYSVCEDYKVKCRSIQPYLTAVMAKVSNQLTEIGGFVLLESETMRLVSLQNGQCVQVKTAPLDSNNVSATLSIWLKREQRLQAHLTNDWQLCLPAHLEKKVDLQVNLLQKQLGREARFQMLQYEKSAQKTLFGMESL